MFCKTQWSFQGIKLTRFLESLDKNSADKIEFKKDKGVESALPHAN